jgi:energy-coupling factor transport system ATP-binding protein
MEVPIVRLVLENSVMSRPDWSLAADGTFTPGIHLVSGDVGSGKSTLALLMAGLAAPRRGAVIREGIGPAMLSFQFPEFHVTGLSVADECRSWGLEPGPVLVSAGLDLSMDRPALSLSRGELKRLHLACLLSREYDLLLLDEPFSSLDCPGKEWAAREIGKRSRGITVVFTHEQCIFPRTDHIWEIQEGALVDCGGMPGALRAWEHAPALIRRLVMEGTVPYDLTQDAIMEAACRIRE